MSTWLQDGKSAIHEAFVHAFHKIEEGATAGMRRCLRGSASKIYTILTFDPQSYKSATAGTRS